jgi:hypothetical protein
MHDEVTPRRLEGNFLTSKDMQDNKYFGLGHAMLTFANTQRQCCYMGVRFWGSNITRNRWNWIERVQKQLITTFLRCTPYAIILFVETCLYPIELKAIRKLILYGQNWWIWTTKEYPMISAGRTQKKEKTCGTCNVRSSLTFAIQWKKAA